VKCSQIAAVRNGKHYTHKEIIDIYWKLTAKYAERENKKQLFESFVEEYRKGNNYNFEKL
jgi:hypothetical protein